MTAPHPIQRRYLAEQIVRLRRADEEERYASSQRQGRIDPNPHQIDAVIFALKRIPEGGCILADEVGLGKTIEAGLVSGAVAGGGRGAADSADRTEAATGAVAGRVVPALQHSGRRKAGWRPARSRARACSLWAREAAGSERGAAILRECEPFDLCVIDEAHEIFANIYRRYDKDGIYLADSDQARMADRVRSFLRHSPVLLLTATPIQNNLTELWGLVQYVEPTGTLLGNLRTFRDVFCGGDDRLLVPGQDDELRQPHRDRSAADAAAAGAGIPGTAVRRPVRTDLRLLDGAAREVALRRRDGVPAGAAPAGLPRQSAAASADRIPPPDGVVGGGAGGESAQGGAAAGATGETGVSGPMPRC